MAPPDRDMAPPLPPELVHNVNKVALLFFIFPYSTAYNIGNNNLTYTHLVELFPYAERAWSIYVKELFGRLAGFFTTYVNSIAHVAVSWKMLWTEAPAGTSAIGVTKLAQPMYREHGPA